jgi:hypothetical protein
MVVLAIFTLNFAHPGLFLQPPAPSMAEMKLESMEQSRDGESV